MVMHLEGFFGKYVSTAGAFKGLLREDGAIRRMREKDDLTETVLTRSAGQKACLGATGEKSLFYFFQNRQDHRVRVDVIIPPVSCGLKCPFLEDLYNFSLISIDLVMFSKLTAGFFP
jgi:hypothetical protein